MGIFWGLVGNTFNILYFGTEGVYVKFVLFTLLELFHYGYIIVVTFVLPRLHNCSHFCTSKFIEMEPELTGIVFEVLAGSVFEVLAGTNSQSLQDNRGLMQKLCF